MADSSDLFDDEVDGLGRFLARSAGGVERKDLVSPDVDGSGQSGQFEDFDIGGECGKGTDSLRLAQARSAPA